MNNYATFLFLLPIAVSAQINPNLSLQPGPVVTLQTGANMSALAIADFNSDNRGDVAVCQRGLNSIAVYLQSSGAYSTGPNGTYPTGTSPTGLVAVPLTNIIGRPPYDLVAISGPSYQWTLLLNTGNGQGTFTSITPSTFFGTGAISTAPQLSAAYLNRDNYIDFVYSYDGPQQNSIMWKAYNGGGSFGNTNIALTGGITPPGFAVVDFDRDGINDVTWSNPTGNTVEVIFGGDNNGSTNWYYAPHTASLPTGFSQPVDVAVGDLNADLQPDIAAANAGSNSVTVYLNTATYQFGSPANYPLSAAPRRLLLQDLNGDGYPELIAITADNKLQVFRHTGTTGAARYGTPITLATGMGPALLQVADMDGDLQKDVIVGCPSDNTVRIYLNRSQCLVTAAPQLVSVGIFPNPATDLLRIDAPNLHEAAQATLLDVTGRTVREATLLPANYTLPVADLPRGLYLLRLTTSAGSRTWHVALK